MAADEQPDKNIGQVHSNELFDHVANGVPNELKPHNGDGGISTTDGLARAEKSAAHLEAAKKSGLGAQEKDPWRFVPGGRPTAEQLYQKSKENRKKGGKRGIFIGIGAGGGIVSIVAGFGFLMPFKLPGIMDTLINDAGKRIEKVVERRGERAILQYFFEKDLIATGNPLGDFFANLRTSKFESRLKDQYGLEFNRDSRGILRVTANGRELGNFKNADELAKFLDRDDLNIKEVRKAMKLVVRNEIPFWRFFKRAKFMKWLRLKYNIPRFGASEQKSNESDEDYKKRIAREHIETNRRASLQNILDLGECARNGGDCSDLNKGGGVDDLEKGAQQAVEAVTDQAVDDLVRGAERSGVKLLTAKLTGIFAALSIPFFGTIDLGARLQHALGKMMNDNTLQKLHAKFISRATAMLGSTYAGYADQTKAGGLAIDMSGMFAGRLTGWEDSAAYSLINNGTDATGEKLDPMERINDAIAPPAFADFLKTMFNTVGWIGRAPLEAWYLTISQAMDLAGDVIGDITTFLAKKVPGYKAIMEQFAKVMDLVVEGLMKLVGMYIDPGSIGPKLAMYIHEGFLSAFNDHGQELGMRLLSHDQALVVDNQIRQDRMDEMASTSLADRVFNLSNSNSLVSHLVAVMPAGNDTSILGTLAEGSVKVVASAPANFARATSGTAFAADLGSGPGGSPAPTVTSEELYGKKMYGGTAADMDAPLHANASAVQELQCPENNDNFFNHCRVDRDIIVGANCFFKRCTDIDNQGGAGFTQVSQTQVSGDLKQLATQILANKNISFQADDKASKKGVYLDISLASEGHPTTSTCGGQVELSVPLLQAILRAAQKYTFQLNAMVSDHSCNNGFHPKGKAVDIGLVNGKTAIATENIPLYRQFAIDMSTYMTTGGRIGQRNCIGVQKLSNGVTMPFDDSCDHLHVDVP